MATIIDYETECCKLFLSWASEYVYLPYQYDDIKLLTIVCLQVLLKNNIFNIDEIKNELKRNKIVLPQHYLRGLE